MKAEQAPQSADFRAERQEREPGSWDNISFLGMPRSGKSTTAKEVAKKLGPEWKLVSIDDEIVKQEGMSIPEIFEKKGQAYFRQVETELGIKFLDESNNVIDFGGGAVENSSLIKHLFRRSRTYYLKATIRTILSRGENDTTRPSTTDETDEAVEMVGRLNRRRDRYEFSDKTVPVEGKTPKEIANEIVEDYHTSLAAEILKQNNKPLAGSVS